MANSQIVRDSLISERCKNLLLQRDRKVQIIQKLNDLKRRNLKLFTEVAPHKETYINKIEMTRNRINNNLLFEKTRLKNMEEKIVRRGCPGIIL
jgi:hypothetical protein